MSKILKAFKNLNVFSQEPSIQIAKSTVIKSANMTTQVILSNGLKFPRIGRECLVDSLTFVFSNKNSGS